MVLRPRFSLESRRSHVPHGSRASSTALLSLSRHCRTPSGSSAAPAYPSIWSTSMSSMFRRNTRSLVIRMIPKSTRNSLEEQLYLESTAKSLATVSPVSWSQAVVSGLDSDGILQRAQHVKADLIVMTTHARAARSSTASSSAAWPMSWSDKLKFPCCWFAREMVLLLALCRTRASAEACTRAAGRLTPGRASSGTGPGLRAVVGGSLYVASSHRSQPGNRRRVAEPTAPAGTGTRGGGKSVPGEDRRTAAARKARQCRRTLSSPRTPHPPFWRKRKRSTAISSPWRRMDGADYGGCCWAASPTR